MDALLTLAGEAAPDLLAAWPTRVFHARGVLDRFSTVLRLAQLDGHAQLGELAYVRAKRWSQDQAGQHSRKFLDYEDVIAWTRGDGAGTLVLDGCTPWQHGQGDFVERLASQLCAGTPSAAQVNLFAARQGGRTRSHFDCQEVIVLQVHGLKQWQISPTPAYFSPSIGSLDLVRLPRLLEEAGGRFPCPPATWEEHVLYPGDVLFLPRGCWHAATALSDSVSLTFSFVTSTIADAIGQQLASALRSVAQFRAVPDIRNPSEFDELKISSLVKEIALAITRTQS